MVDDDLERAVGTTLVLERVLDLGNGTLERREVIFAHRGRGISIQDRLAVLEAHRLRANREGLSTLSLS